MHGHGHHGAAFHHAVADLRKINKVFTWKDWLIVICQSALVCVVGIFFLTQLMPGSHESLPPPHRVPGQFVVGTNE